VQVPGTRLYYAHAENLEGARTFVLLGTQQHLTFVADFPMHLDPSTLRALVLERAGVYPHQVDLESEVKPA
jgi:hypothetical protein